MPRHGELRRDEFPPRILGDVLTSFFVFAGTLIILHPFTGYRPTGVDNDEFTMLYDSVRVLHGQIPYRDFFNFPGPAMFYLHAAVFAIFGTRVLVAQWLLVCTMAVTATVVYRAALHVVEKRLLALLSPLIQVLILFPSWPRPSHHWYALFGISLILLCGTKLIKDLNSATKEPPRRWFWFTGLACALTTLFIQTDGLLALAAVVSFLLLWGRQQKLPLLGKHISAIGQGFALGILPPVVCFTALGALQPAMWDMFVWPLQHYHGAGAVNTEGYAFDINYWIAWQDARNNLPLFLFSLLKMSGIIAIPPLVIAVGGILLFRRTALSWRQWFCPAHRAPQLSGKTGVPINTASAMIKAEAVFVLSVAACGFLGMLLTRRDVIHSIFASAPAYLGALALLNSTGNRGQSKLLAPIKKAAWYCLLLFVGSGGILFWHYYTQEPWVDPDQALQQAPIVQQVLPLLRGHKQDESIVVVPYGGLAYFYTAPSAIKYTLLLPPALGYNTLNQFNDAVEDIVRHRPALIIYDRDADKLLNLHWSLDFDKRLADYLHAHYQVLTIKKNPLVIYQRRGL